ncbi:alpha/beta hydrolase [Halalkalibacillus sediminis]|uniref:Alpha/beta hydrolase n=1 Tax=Halalkalibacillus sediminis TaxID=2018042 RepID=A0A2I0QU50_9BACI|nr:alpha/beta hydrolase [Halalkalibacillus sediminis]PKR77856.1 alpha/beta hydrolase [Halalkalibacillus sediminis]
MEYDVQLKNDRLLHVNDSGGEGLAVIGVHGLTGNHKQLQFFYEAIGENYRMITYDLLGRGLSSEAGEESSIGDHARDLIDLIETLKLEKVVLLGYSIGAFICSQAASQSDNVEALILLDGAGVPDKGQKDMILPSLSRVEKRYSSPEDYIEQTREAYEKIGIEWTSHHETIARYEIQEVKGGWIHRSKADVLKSDFDSFFTFDHQKVFENIFCPTLLIIATGKMNGQRPLFLKESFNILEELIENLRIKHTKANHLTLVFNKQTEVNESVMTFLREVRKGGQ